MIGYPDTMWREFDPQPVNEVGNHADVRPTLGPGGELDFTGFMGDRRNIVLGTAGGYAMLAWCGPDMYEAHLMFLPEHRGASALAAGRAMIDVMRDIYGARVLWARTQIANRSIALYTRMVGFEFTGRGDDPDLGAVNFYVKDLCACHPR